MSLPLDKITSIDDERKAKLVKSVHEKVRK